MPSEPADLIERPKCLTSPATDSFREEANPASHVIGIGTEWNSSGGHPETLTSINNLAVVYWDQGKYQEAEPLYMKVCWRLGLIHGLDAMRRVLGEEHPDTLSSMNSLARLYQDQGEYEKAEPLILEGTRSAPARAGATIS